MLKIYFVALFLLASNADAAVKIAGAADLRVVLQKLIADYKSDHPSVEFVDTYGSSGEFVSQIKSGADFDLFMSADTDFANQIVKADLADGAPQAYAKSILTLCGTEKISSLTDAKFKKISIANPQHAPYGKMAEEALKKANVYDKVKSKLVLGENVSQAAQFVQTGAAQAGLIAQSLTYADSMKNLKCEVVEERLYTPAVQAVVVLKKSKEIKNARDFAAYLVGKKAQDIFAKSGFQAPPK